MKKERFILLLTGLMLVMAVFAADKDLTSDIIMVSYEQDNYDSAARISLKNNTSERIDNIGFMLTYLDMSGNELDYEEFGLDVNIAPGKTKIIEINPFGYNHNYHYYTSPNKFGHSFKVEYELMDYNFEVEEDSAHASSSDDHDPFLKWMIGAYLIMVSLSIGFFVLVVVMAKKRHRNVAVWVLLSIIGTPVLMTIILLIIGDADYYDEDTDRLV